MVRTKNTANVKVAGEKALRKLPPTPNSSKSDAKNKYSGGNPYCPRETPNWQKPITQFFGSSSHDGGGSSSQFFGSSSHDGGSSSSATSTVTSSATSTVTSSTIDISSEDENESSDVKMIDDNCYVVNYKVKLPKLEKHITLSSSDSAEETGGNEGQQHKSNGTEGTEENGNEDDNS